MRTINSPDNTPKQNAENASSKSKDVTTFVSQISAWQEFLVQWIYYLISISKYDNCQPFNQILSALFPIYYINLQIYDEFRTAPASHPFDANLWDSWLLELEPPNNEPELAASEPSPVRKQLWDKSQTYPNVVSFGWFCIQM